MSGTCHRAAAAARGLRIELSCIRQDGYDPRAVSCGRSWRYSPPSNRRGTGAAVVGHLHYRNVAGGSQTIASLRLARATPDDYTLTVGTIIDLCHQSDDEDYARLRIPQGFRSGLVDVVAPQYLFASPKFVASTIGELIVESKKSSGKFTYFSRSWHFAAHRGRVMAHRAGISMRHVPYTGAAPRSAM